METVFHLTPLLSHPLPRPDWYGMLYSQADSKKKSNLMMSLFEPGPLPLPWLGKIAQLGPTSGTSAPVRLAFTDSCAGHS